MGLLHRRGISFFPFDWKTEHMSELTVSFYFVLLREENGFLRVAKNGKYLYLRARKMFQKHYVIDFDAVKEHAIFSGRFSFRNLFHGKYFRCVASTNWRDNSR